MSDPRLGRQPGLSVVGITARIGRNDVDSSGIVIDADRGLVLTSAVGEGAIWIIDARDGQLTRVGP